MYTGLYFEINNLFLYFFLFFIFLHKQEFYDPNCSDWMSLMVLLSYQCVWGFELRKCRLPSH